MYIYVLYYILIFSIISSLTMRNTYCIVITTFTFFFLLITHSHCEILFVFELFRHGARGPKFISPQQKGDYTDKYGVIWNSEMCVTPIGIRMQYLLGVRNRYKYSTLLSTIYDPKDLIVYSSRLNRHIISAQAQLQGMFPPQIEGTLSFNELDKAYPPNVITTEIEKEITRLGNNALPDKIQFIPIHDFNPNELSHLRSEAATCPPLLNLKNKLRKQELFTNFYNKLNNTYGIQLKQYFQLPDTKFLYDYYRVFYLCDTFISDYDNKRNLSSLKAKGIDLDEFYKLCLEMKSLYLYHGESNEFIGVLAASPTMRKIITWMEMRIQRDKCVITTTNNSNRGNRSNKKNNINNTSSNNSNNDVPTISAEPKFVMYSGGDTTMGPFQLFMNKAFGVELVYPSFCSNILFELHKTENKTVVKGSNNVNGNSSDCVDEYYVEYYMDDELKVKIGFKEFKREVEKIMWSEDRIMQYCSPPLKGKIILLIVAGMIVVIFVLFLMLSSFFCSSNEQSKKKKKTKRDNSSISNEHEDEDDDDKGEELQSV